MIRFVIATLLCVCFAVVSEAHGPQFSRSRQVVKFRSAPVFQKQVIRQRAPIRSFRETTIINRGFFGRTRSVQRIRGFK